MKTKLLAAGLFIAVAGCGTSASSPDQSSQTSERWNPQNDPFQLGSSYVRNFNALPVSGQLDNVPWSDTYWPSVKAGVAQRWRGTTANQFFYPLYNFQQVQSLPQEVIATLSPAEKFDLFNGRYDYPLVQMEWQRTQGAQESWEGLCHGWAPAAVRFKEPKPIVATSVHGIKIPFGSSDIKALLTYHEGQVAQAPQKVLGARCNVNLNEFPQEGWREECRDTNAGAFHIVLANQIGLMKESFLADVTRDFQVWNQPIHGFESVVLGEQGPSQGAAFGTVREVRIKTSMTYTIEGNPQQQPLLGTTGHLNKTKTYLYRVELDASGQIIGGEWESEDRPDFLWQQQDTNFYGAWKNIEVLYNLSQQ